MQTLSGSIWYQRERGEAELESLKLPAYLKSVFASRHVSSKQQLDYSLKNLPRPEDLRGISAALELLYQTRVDQKNILIVGDYDADGATSTALLLTGLRKLGFQNVDYLVPDRFTLGYGLTPEVVELAVSNSSFFPHLIITVDNGISSISGVARANQLNIDVLVTDHHLPGEALPDAAAIINPNQPACEFPSKNLAGVGVAFYLLIALRAFLSNKLDAAELDLVQSCNLAELLDLVAIGTVADLVKLDSLNRTLVFQGISRIRAGHTRPGVLALLNQAGRDYRNLQTSDIGFGIAPRLNAAGRMDDMAIGIECLLTNSEGQAQQLAASLDQLNQQRRSVEGAMREQAEKDLQDLHIEAKNLPSGLTVYRESWHEGVVGIVAGRIKEKFHRPVVAFAKSSGETLKGSARSVPGIHIRDVLADIHASSPNLINRFGGHAMAAGLSLHQDNLEQFKKVFAIQLTKQEYQSCLKQVLYHDGELASEFITLESAHQLSAAGPWGQAFEEPIFIAEFTVERFRVLKEKHLKLWLKTDQEASVEAIAFNIDVDQVLDKLANRIKLAFNLSINDYRGQQSLQLMIQDFAFPE